VVAPDQFPSFLRWLPGCEEVLVYEKQSKEVKEAVARCSALFCLDFNAPDRMGDLEETITSAGKPIAVIDHHRFPADFAEAYYTDDKASSTAELIYRLAVELDLDQYLDAISATCLYTGLVTDTGSFRFSSVNARVLHIAAALLDTGMNHLTIYDHIFDNNRLDQLKLKGYALSEKMVVTGAGQVAYISLNIEELKRFHYRPGDTEGLVNYALSIEGVHLAAFFSEKEDLIKISLRSKGQVDVNEFARKYFEGGGHIHAAGGRSRLSLAETIEKFETAIASVVTENV
jgi:phosphoesterase RecJ-like protein